MVKRIPAFLLTFVLAVGLMPLPALAHEPADAAAGDSASDGWTDAYTLSTESGAAPHAYGKLASAQNMPVSSTLVYDGTPHVLAAATTDSQRVSNATAIDADPQIGDVEQAKEADSISIVFTNDVHCAIDPVREEGKAASLGYPGVAAVVDDAEAEHGTENVTLVDAGDAVQGGPLGTLTDGEAIVDIMNAVGYDYAVPGNHEFDYGMDRFNELVGMSDATYLSSNFVDAQGNPVLVPYAIETYEGVSDGTASGDDAQVSADPAADGVLKVAYVGVSTPETLTKSAPAHFQDGNGNYIYGFCGDSTGQALYDAVQDAVDAATAEGADYVVAIGHLGNEGTTKQWTSSSVIANTTGIDAFIDGHSHETYATTASNAEGEDVILAQTGTKLANVGELTIDPAAEDDVTVELIGAEGYTAVAEDVQSVVDDANAEFAELLSQVAGTSEVDLMSQDEATNLYVRWQETNLGDFVADAYRSALGSDIGLVNGGGVRASIGKGDVTYYDLISVQPFGNELCEIEATGQQLLDALEMGVSKLPESSGGFPQVSGITFKVNTAISSSVVTDDHGNFLKVAGDYRVYDVMVGGEPLDLQKTYTIASHSYMLLDGGDGMTMFVGASVLQDRVMIDNQVLIEYMKQLGGVIGSQYVDPAGEGRILLTDGYIADDETAPPAGQVDDSVFGKPFSGEPSSEKTSSDEVGSGGVSDLQTIAAAGDAALPLALGAVATLVAAVVAVRFAARRIKR